MRIEASREGDAYTARAENRDNKGDDTVKAKLLRKAGKIPKGSDVEVVSKVADRGECDPRDAGHPEARTPAYAVKDDASHEETVDTRDLKPLL